MAAVDSTAELNSLLEQWTQENNGIGISPIPVLKSLAELIERETEAYFKMDPDPFDDRHPGRADPKCGLGHLLKCLFKNDDFMNKIVNTYLLCPRDQENLQTAACRILLDILPGLETSVVFNENDEIVRRLLHWAEVADEPLRSYATGLLPGAMEVQDIAASFRENNARLVPIMIARLHKLWEEKQNEMNAALGRPFAGIGKGGKEKEVVNGDVPAHCGILPQKSDVGTSPEKSRVRRGSFSNENSSSWAEMQPYVIGSHCMEPLSIDMRMRLIVQYLAPMGEYQELLSSMFECDAISLIYNLIDLKMNKDIRLAFDGLRFLASLLCHKKFAIKFIQSEGVQRLLGVYRPSIAATGVSLCLYYLAYFEDAMERVCLLPEHILSDLVNYVLWLLECSHQSGRCHATMFFSASFQFRIILNLFDAQDGLRRMFNVMSTLKILGTDETDPQMSEDEVFVSRQAARHVCVGLKKYFEAHLVIKTDELRRSHARREGGSPIPAEIPAYKSAQHSPDVLLDYTELLLECLPLRMHWKPVSDFIKLDGITLLLRLIAIADEWTQYTGKGPNYERHVAETIRSALDALAVCTVSPKTQVQLCESIPLPENTMTPAISILLGVAEGEVFLDSDVQRSALNVIINCVCGPMARIGGNVVRFMTGSAKKRTLGRTDDIIAKMWDCVRSNNGIMVLLKLLMIKTPITEADSIRALACRALLGLSRDEKVKQIIGKLSLFNNGQLQMLMKEPVLQDKRLEHLKFCKYATELIERVSGRSNSANYDASLEKIRKADIVAQTKITYDDKELLQLMHDHLTERGLVQSAQALQVEANLPKIAPTPVLPENPCIYSTPKALRQMSHGMSSVAHGGTPVAGMSSGPRREPTTPGTSTSIKVNVIHPKVQTPQKVPNPIHKIIREKMESTPATPVLKRSKPSITLDKIVTEYLRKQHSLCVNPMVTCPRFSLLEPHRCPISMHRKTAPYNIASRLFQRSVDPLYGGPHGAKWDRKYLYSRFRPIRTYRDTEEDGCFSCCAFSACEQYLILGTYAGELKLYNVQTAEEHTYAICHNSPLSHCQPSKDGKLVLTSSSWGTPQSALWSLGQEIVLKYAFDDDNYTEFSKLSQDRIIGTKNDAAQIYDVQTGAKIVQFHDPDKSNNYMRNRATFSPCDDLVLSDGLLWDVRSRKLVHKFDKFNPDISGQFHPFGLEIVINTEVWDIRSFALLRTVPALDQCQIMFNNAGTVIYGANFPIEEFDDLEDGKERSPLGSSFRTFDATDYTNIATIDVKKNVIDLCTDQSDCYLAVVENVKSPDTLSEESVCRLYEVGQLRDEEDDQVDEEDEEEEMEDDEDDDDEDDDDDDDDDDVEFELVDEDFEDGSSASGNDDDDDHNGSNNSDQTDSSDSNPAPQDGEPTPQAGLEAVFRPPNPPRWTRVFDQLVNRHST